MCRRVWVEFLALYKAARQLFHALSYAPKGNYMKTLLVFPVSVKWVSWRKNLQRTVLFSPVFAIPGSLIDLLHVRKNLKNSRLRVKNTPIQLASLPSLVSSFSNWVQILGLYLLLLSIPSVQCLFTNRSSFNLRTTLGRTCGRYYSHFLLSIFYQFY